MGKKIGIDLGTTYSCMSYVDEMNVVKIIDNFEGEQTTPSVVFFDPNGDAAVVGDTAREAGAMNPECLCERVKNYMGNPDYRFFANGQEYSAAAVSKLILQKLIDDAQRSLGDDIDGAVITCPAYFGEEAKFATKVAGENVVLANGQNLKVLKILDEPTAAAIAYGYSKQEEMDKVILIYDLGGGTFDCTVMKYSFIGDNRSMQVITTGGNHQLGGKDWDATLTELVMRKFCESTGCDIDQMREDPEMRAWFSENIEKAKKNLTSRESTMLAPSYDGFKERIEITREEFDAETKLHLDQTIALVDDMLKQKGMSIADIDEIVLVGGSTKMPQVEKRLEQEYGKPMTSYQPDKAVAMGAALVAQDAQEVTENTDDHTGKTREEGQPQNITLTGADGSSTTIIEACTKSYGLRIISNGEPKVLNLILKDTVKPAHGCSSDHFPLTINGDPALVSEVDILVLESDSSEELITLEECQEIYLEEPIKFEGAVPGDNQVAVDMYLDANSLLSLVLTDLVTGKSYPMVPKRKSDDANQVGMDSVKGMTLK